MMPDDWEPKEKDKTRLCPSCRMQISVLATKCRFCGESVTRPRVEDRHLTIHDLGGDAPGEYKVSDSIVTALEAFRVDEQARREADGAEGIPSPEGAVEGLDVRGIGPVRGASTKRETGPQWFVLALVLVAAALLVSVAAGTWASHVWARAGGVHVAAAPASRAAWEQSDEKDDLVRTLAGAVEAVKRNETDANLKRADMVRERIAREVDALLRAHPFQIKNVERAHDLMRRVRQIDSSHPVLQAAGAEVDEDYYAYSMTLVNLDEQSGTGVVRYTYPRAGDPAQEKVAKGDKIRGRFVVRGVGPDYLLLEDVLRPSASGVPRLFRLYRDGRIVASGRAGGGTSG